MFDFNNISLRGRIAYGIMCAENYVLQLHPERDWRPVFEVLWGIADEMYWDDWASDVIEILPEYISDSIQFDPDDFEKLDEEGYKHYCMLYRDMPASWAAIMREIVDMEEMYAFTTIPGTGSESIDSLKRIDALMEGEGVSTPNPKAVAFSLFSQNNGRGDPFDAKKLSKVIGD